MELDAGACEDGGGVGCGSFGEDPGTCTFEGRQEVARLTPDAEQAGSQADEQLGVLI